MVSRGWGGHIARLCAVAFAAFSLASVGYLTIAQPAGTPSYVQQISRHIPGVAGHTVTTAGVSRRVKALWSRLACGVPGNNCDEHRRLSG
jgi:hypothetical protein